MNMMEAVKSVYSNYVKFSGRSRRAEFWWFYLFYLIVNIVLSVVDSFLFGTTTTYDGGFSSSTDTPILSGIFALGTFLPFLAVSVRRLHDIGKSGWWLFISLVPLVGIILLIVWWAKEGEAGGNDHGPNPITGEGGSDDGGESYAETSIPKV